WSPQRY
ncbi:HAD ATPase, P-type, IC family protein, partial [Vibrio parahaemolyticus V-223/04]